MSKPPIKAMEAVKRYCQKNKDCRGCPLYNGIGKYAECVFLPQMWRIKEEGEEK